MKAAYVEKTGPPKNIIYGDLPKPAPTGSEVLVKVEAVAVNPVDTYLRAGTIEMDLPMPFTVGCDLAGTIEESAQAATQIAASSQQQANGVEQLVSAMESIRQASVQTTASMRQAESSARSLSDLAQQMEEAVARYQLGG